VNVEPAPQITYHAEFGDPNESDITLRYFQSDNPDDVVIEIYQRHTPGLGTPRPIDIETYREASTRALLAWVVGWPQVDNTRGQISVAVTGYESEGLERELFEITEPASLSANMVKWVNDPVYYRVYTHLSATEAQSIADSLTDCAAPMSLQ
jgi:hypothetical protein